MEKGRGVWERPWRRREEQGRGASDGGVKMSRDQGGSSRRGRGETRKGGDRGAANGGGNSPWMARGWQRVRRRPSGFQAPRESRTSSGYDRQARPSGASSGDDLHRWGRAAASPDRRGRAAGRSSTGRPSKWQAGQGNPWRAEQMRARPRAGREIFERSPAR